MITLTLKIETLKNFIKPGQISSIPPLCNDGVIYSDPNDKANIFNIFYGTNNAR